MTTIASSFVIIILTTTIVYALDNGLARTPGMGYNTWNDFRCTDKLNDANIRKVADTMVQNGLAKLGYQYVNLDDCWAVSRDSNTGRLVADPKTFPNGIKAVADYVHSKNMKFGIYTDRGNVTCQKRPASGGHEIIDAETFASWGVDYVKEDSCNATQNPLIAEKEYAAMRDALNKTGRPIYFSLCGWMPWYAAIGDKLGNSWRIAQDVNQWPTIYNAIYFNKDLGKYASPGGWNDPDMLIGSTPGAAVYNTPTQARTQFSLWSIMAAPLIIGSNILNLSAWDLETYSNAEVIAVDQDKLGIQGYPIYDTCGGTTELLTGGGGVPACQQVWMKPLENKNTIAIAYVNFATESVNITCDTTCFSKIGASSTSYNVRDLWLHKDIGVASTSYSVQVDGNGGSKTFLFSKK